uniref:Uncharacterized protein n=1 Tax=Lygus hesperus TaxID=30085 RepID=A0A0A9WT24_LYGHE
MKRTFSDPYSLTMITDTHQLSPEVEDSGVTSGNGSRKDKSFVATVPDIMGIMRWYKRSIEPEEADADHPLGKWAEWVRIRRKMFKNLSKKSNNRRSVCPKTSANATNRSWTKL